MRQGQVGSSSAPSAASGAAALFLEACLLIRGIFLYAIPGGLFFAIGLISGRLSLTRINTFLAPYHPPTWALALLATATCYLAGHLLYAVVSLRAELWQLIHWGDSDWLARYPTQVTPRDLVVRHYFPDLYRQMDSREASRAFLFSSIAALVIGWLIFLQFRPPFADVIIGTAVLIFVATLTWMTGLGRMRTALHEASKEIERREETARQRETVIQPTGDELRFVIDSIFRAAELTSPKQPSNHQPAVAAELQAPGPAPQSGSSPEDRPSAASTPQASTRSFGTPRL